jgi:NAD(P)H-dependent flavin oxidoreductase YrpB (nitropropane dioxygenase family)
MWQHRRVPASLKTRLCDLLGIELPILSAGMGSVAGPELVAAVSNAGGFGVLGVSGASPDGVRKAISSARALTARPFGVNVIIDEEGWAPSEDDRALVRAEIESAAGAGVAAIVVFWGDPRPFVAMAHANGVALIVQVGSLAEAESAADAGVDAVSVRGLEAGGHVRGTTSVWDLLPATVEKVAPVPVLASGGIGDGAGIARALRLGAQGVSLGTRFVASDESRAHPDYKRRIIESAAEDTVYTEDLYDLWWPGAPHRTLRNRNFDEWEAAGRPAPGNRPGEGTTIGTMRLGSGETYELPRYVGAGSPLVTFEGELDYMPMWAGESVGAVHEVLPTAEIVSRLAADAAVALDGR